MHRYRDTHEMCHTTVNTTNKSSTRTSTRSVVKAPVALLQGEPSCCDIMLWMTSKRIRGVVDKMILTVGVHLNRNFWDETRNDEILQFVLRKLTELTTQYRISIRELPNREMKGHDTECLVGVLAH